MSEDATSASSVRETLSKNLIRGEGENAPGPPKHDKKFRRNRVALPNCLFKKEKLEEEKEKSVKERRRIRNVD